MPPLQGSSFTSMASTPVAAIEVGNKMPEKNALFVPSLCPTGVIELVDGNPPYGGVRTA